MVLDAPGVRSVVCVLAIALLMGGCTRGGFVETDMTADGPLLDLVPDSAPSLDHGIDDARQGGVETMLPLERTLFHYTFDAYRYNAIADASGSQLSATYQGVFNPSEAGKLGSAISGRMKTYIPHAFSSNVMTLECWVWLRSDAVERQVIISDDRDGPLASLELVVAPASGFEFVTNEGCAASQAKTFTAAAALVRETWYHVAVTWDGSDLRFYLDGALLSTSPAAFHPCPSQRGLLLGRRPTDAFDISFDGTVDELALANYAKSESEIIKSMNTPPRPHCGDGHLSDSEQCEVGALCCDPARCRYLADGSPCGQGTCRAGSCDHDGGRVADGLVVLYTFEEGKGMIVRDRSNRAPPLDLQLPTAGASWGSGYLDVTHEAALRPNLPSTKVVDALQRSGAYTIEAWIEPGANTETQDHRIITLDSTDKDVSLLLAELRGRPLPMFGMRARSRLSTKPGYPSLHAPGQTLPVDRATHLVTTVDSAGERRIYVDGRLRASARLPSPLSIDLSHRLSLGATTDGTGGWAGSYHLVAIYDRALDAVEVARNNTAGP